MPGSPFGFPFGFPLYQGEKGGLKKNAHIPKQSPLSSSAPLGNPMGGVASTGLKTINTKSEPATSNPFLYTNLKKG